jgi:uncharacterized membrane protein
MNLKSVFHGISYLQYPLMLAAIIYLIKGYYILFTIKDLPLVFNDINTCLVFMGLALSFATLQDTTKTQNKFSRKIYENPRKGKLFITSVTVFTCILLITGMIGFLRAEDNLLSEFSFGLLMLGIGFIGVLKSAIEMFENHRLDRQRVA